MKTPEEWAKFEFENPLIKTGDFIAMIQKDAYNQAIEDASNNAEANYMEVDDSNFSIGFRVDSFVEKDSILKLKIR
jgi:hypothetical protein